MPCTLGLDQFFPQGTLGKLGDSVVRGHSQDQATWMLERQGVGRADASYPGPAGTSMRQQPEEHVLWVQIPATTPQGRAQLPCALQPQLSTNHARTESAPSTATSVSGCSPPSKLFTSFFSCSSILGNVTLTALHPPREDPGDFLVYQWDSPDIKR